MKEGGVAMQNNNFRIITCGLSQEEINIVIDNLPKKDYKLDVFDTVYDLIAQYASIYIINVAVFEENELDLLWNYYKEINENTDESIFLLGKSTIPHELKKTFLCFDSFQDFRENLNYHLLKAYTKSKKSKDFSTQLADCIMILSLIRNKPGIKTKELAESLEKSGRTVNRYINTLQMAGEWIVYDSVKKGWVLEYGTSQLFEVYFEKGD